LTASDIVTNVLMAGKEVPQITADHELAEAMGFLSSPEGGQALAPGIEALSNSEAEAHAWLSYLGEKKALSLIQKRNLKRDHHIGGVRKSHHYEDWYMEEKTENAVFKQAAASVAVQQEIEEHLMGSTQGGEYEVSLTDPVQDQDQNTNTARVVVYNSDASSETGVPLSLRSVTPDESAAPKLTRADKKALRNEQRNRGREEARAHKERYFGEFNPGSR